MNEKLKAQSIDRLDVADNALNILKENNINTIGSLIKNSKSDLKKLDIAQDDINKIDIELQLLGMNLKGSL